MSRTNTITLTLDDDDHRWVLAAVAKYQQHCRDGYGVMLPEVDIETDLRSRIIAEICRGFADPDFEAVEDDQPHP